jgi:hypothetical protein
MRPLHEKVSGRLILACAGCNRQAFACEDQFIKSRRAQRFSLTSGISVPCIFL